MLLLFAFAAGNAAAADRAAPPDGFDHLDDAIPGLVVELRYATGGPWTATTGSSARRGGNSQCGFRDAVLESAAYPS